MQIWRSIRFKALLMLVTFAASFAVFCHCRVMAAVPKTVSCSCCEKKPAKQTPSGDCNGMRAIQFHLLEKQVAPHLLLKQLPAAILPFVAPAPVAPYPLTKNTPLPALWVDKHSPPDLLTLYQRFLI
jgi:hypothetical protein